MEKDKPNISIIYNDKDEHCNDNHNRSHSKIN